MFKRIAASKAKGQRFKRLVVLKIYYPADRSQGAWAKCRCDCGKILRTRLSSLRNGSTRSCGCFKRERTIEANTRRVIGEIKSPEYKTWYAIQQRCFNPKCSSYFHYGGRGIKVCKRWLGKDGYNNFLKDMKRRPSARHSLDRYPDNDGDYEPGNCRWATPKQQGENKSSSIRRKHALIILGFVKVVSKIRKLTPEEFSLANRLILRWRFKKKYIFKFKGKI